MSKDLISRQVAIEAIVNTPSGVDENKTLKDKYDGAAFRQHEILDIIESMPSAQQWIPVEERLPDENGSYLTTTRNGRVRVNHFYKYHGIFGYQNNVIAWMPQPEPYKGVE